MLDIQKEKIMDWNGMWQSIVDYFTNNVWNIVKFFAVLVIGIVLIKLIVNVLHRVFNRSKMEKIAHNFIVAIIKFALYLVLVLLLLSIIGVQIGGVVTALSAVLLAIGMALESNIANLANGIVIVSTKMFKKGDFITVGDVSGSITEINFLFTTLLTPDNKKVTLPNSMIVNNAVINKGANPKIRIDFDFGVAYETDVELVKKVVTDVMKSNGKVHLDPAPFCRLKTLGESSINFFANCWVDNEDYWEVYYFFMENVYNEFKRNKISIPYKQIEIRERTDVVKMPVIKEHLPKRVEKQRNTKKHVIDLENDNIFIELKEQKQEIKEKIRKQKSENKKKKEQEKVARKASTKPTASKVEKSNAIKTNKK